MRSRVAVLAVLAVLAAGLLAPPAAPAGQYQGASATTSWAMPGPLMTRWIQDITVSSYAPDTFFNIQWNLIYEPYGYLGIQTPGRNNTAIFSMWGAVKWVNGRATCSSFNNETAGGFSYGTRCLWNMGTLIGNKTLRLELMKVQPTNDADLWWRAYVTVDGTKHRIADIQSPRRGWISNGFNFQEYFGAGNGWNGSYCVPPGPPTSAAVYTGPLVSSPTMTQRRLARTGGGLNRCPGAAAFANPFYDGAAMKLGDT